VKIYAIAIAGSQIDHELAAQMRATHRSLEISTQEPLKQEGKPALIFPEDQSLSVGIPSRQYRTNKDILKRFPYAVLQALPDNYEGELSDVALM
jgi:hypothetical protein